jgi:AAA+ ATPase superfamily predicted ATPase
MSKRQRGVVLTEQGLERLHAKIKDIEATWPSGKRFTRSELAEQATLSPKTVKKIFDAKIGVDKRGLEDLFGAVGLSLIDSDHRCLRSSKVEDSWNKPIFHSQHDIHQHPHQNLPRKINEFIGREQEIKNLLEYISLEYRAPYITVNGIGGVGKTALALEAAYRCRDAYHDISDLNTPKFDAIIFVSAKENKLMPEGGLRRLRDFERQKTLKDIFQKVSDTLKNKTITQAPPDEQHQRVRDCLARQTTLLIVDNLETVEDPSEILGFLDNLPGSTKAIVTTRSVLPSYSHISLDSLPREESMKLIKQQINAKKNVVLSAQERKALYERFGGLPAALIYAVGQIENGAPAKELIDNSIPLPNDIVRYCFENSVAPLRGEPAHKLLMASAFFPKSPTKEALVKVAGLGTEPIYIVKEALEQLTKLSLISRDKGRFKILPLTREYALAELFSEAKVAEKEGRKDFEGDARNRWIAFYENFLKEYGGKDWTGWGPKYQRVESEYRNILALLYWCAREEHYKTIKRMWKHLNHFTSLCGYWEERLHWLNYLIDGSKARSEKSVAIDAMSEKSYTFILMGKLEEAENLLTEAWKQIEETPCNSNLKTHLAQHYAVLYIQKNDHKQARAWIDNFHVLLSESTFTGYERERREIAILCLQAEVYFLLADFNSAKMLATKAIKQSKCIGWQRKANDAEYWLAEIAIAENRLHEAKSILERGLNEAEMNHYESRIALYQSSFARLEKKRGNLEAASNWAMSAAARFERLGMKQKEQEVNLLFSGKEAFN